MADAIAPHDCHAHRFGVEIPEHYDGVLYWECTTCGKAWHRWMAGTRQHAAAQPYIDRENARLIPSGTDATEAGS